MDAATIASTLGSGVLALAAAAAVLVGGRLLWTHGPGHTRGWLGIGLLGTASLIAASAALSLGLGRPQGTTVELVALTAALAGACLLLLEIPFAFVETREGDSSLPGWGPLVPLLVPAGFLAYASMHWPAAPIGAGETLNTWAGGPGYDAVEDAAGSLLAACVASTVLAATGGLLARAVRGPEERRLLARRMLAQAWVPVAGWLAALGVVFALLVVLEAPAHPLVGAAQGLLLHSPLPFALIVVGPLLWGLDRVSPGWAPDGEMQASSSRS